MSRRSANLSRFTGTSQPAAGGYGQQDVDDGAYPLRPLSRNRASRPSWAAAGSAGELEGALELDGFLRATPRANQQNGSEQRKPNSRRKSRLSDAEQEDGYISAGTGDGQEEQDRLLLSSAGVEGAWPLEHPMSRQAGPDASVCSAGLQSRHCFFTLRLLYNSPLNQLQAPLHGSIILQSPTSHG